MQLRSPLQLQQDNEGLRIEESMRNVSMMAQSISYRLLEQTEDVTFVLESAVASRDNVKAGSRELQEAATRPNALRDMAVAILLLLALLLLFLDRFSRP